MARELQSLGFEAAALEGGYNAWRASFPVEPKGAPAGPSPTGNRPPHQIADPR